MDDHPDVEAVTAGARQSSWDAYELMLRRAQAARAQLLYNTLLNCVDRLRERVCATAEKLHINFCPLCCH